MADNVLIVTVRVRWWLRPYLWGVIAVARLTGSEPDEAHVLYWVERGLYVRQLRPRRLREGEGGAKV